MTRRFDLTDAQSIRNLQVPAVFMKPDRARRPAVLNQVARGSQGLKVRKLYGDAFEAAGVVAAAASRRAGP